MKRAETKNPLESDVLKMKEERARLKVKSAQLVEQEEEEVKRKLKEKDEELLQLYRTIYRR